MTSPILLPLYGFADAATLLSTVVRGDFGLAVLDLSSLLRFAWVCELEEGSGL